MGKIEQMLSEGSKISSKRVLLFMVAGLLSVCVVVELFTTKEVRESTITSLFYLVGFGIGAVASEKFSKK